MRYHANLTHRLYALTYNVHRDRDKTEPYTFEPLPGPDRVLTPERKAQEAAELAEAERQRQREDGQVAVGKSVTLQLFSGELTMAEIGRRIQAERGLV